MDRLPRLCPSLEPIHVWGPLPWTSSDTGPMPAILLFIFHRAQTCKRTELGNGSSNIISHKELLSFKKEFIMILILGRLVHETKSESTNAVYRLLTTVTKIYFKGTMLKNLVNNCELDVEAVYGSARDVSIYQSLRLDPTKIFIISKPSRRLASKCKVSNLTVNVDLYFYFEGTLRRILSAFGTIACWWSIVEVTLEYSQSTTLLSPTKF